MFELLKKRVYPAGVDLDSGYLKMSQLGSDSRGLYLHAVGSEAKPADITDDSAEWQKWAIEAVKRVLKKGRFSGRQAITAMPSRDVFIDQIKVSKSVMTNLESVVFDKIKEKLTFEPANAVLKYVVTEDAGCNGENDVLVMAVDKKIVDRHLAVYEKAGLEIKAMSVWPSAITNSYVKFFGRRQTDMSIVSVLIDIGVDCSNIVICRHEKLLLARTVLVGLAQFGQDEMVQRLITEIDACCRYFESCGGHVERLIFLSGRTVGRNRNICDKVAEFAQRMQIPAQVGDVLAAIEVRNGCEDSIDRRDCQVDWTTSFGLSLADAK